MSGKKRKSEEELPLHSSVKFNDELISFTSPKQTKEIPNMKENAPKRGFPTHFLSLRIDHPSILSTVEDIQRQITSTHVYLGQYTIRAIKSHLTLFVLQLKNKEQEEKAKELLENCRRIVDEHYGGNPCSVILKGLGNFSNRVLFADVLESPEKATLRNFAYAMYFQFQQAGLAFEEMKSPLSFYPHSTIMKIRQLNKYNGTSNNSNHQKMIIEPGCYQGHASTHFGEQVFKSVELSVMTEEDGDGYYKCLQRIPFKHV